MIRHGRRAYGAYVLIVCVMLALPLDQVMWLSLADSSSRSWLTAGSSGSATVAACAIDAQAKVSAGLFAFHMAECGHGGAADRRPGPRAGRGGERGRRRGAVAA